MVGTTLAEDYKAMETQPGTWLAQKGLLLLPEKQILHSLLALTHAALSVLALNVLPTAPPRFVQMKEEFQHFLREQQHPHLPQCSESVLVATFDSIMETWKQRRYWAAVQSHRAMPGQLFHPLAGLEDQR